MSNAWPMICPHCAFPNEPGTEVCVKCKRPMSSAPIDSLGDPPNWLKGPDSSAPEPASVEQGDKTKEAVAAARRALENAEELQSGGQLRKAFVECQSVLIDHSHNLPAKISAQVHHAMARISLAQGKRERAEKYLKRALSLDSSLPDMQQIKSIQEEQAAAATPQMQERKSQQPSKESQNAMEKDENPHAISESEPQAAAPGPPEPSPVVQSVNGRLAWAGSFWSRTLAFLIDTVLVATLIAIMVALSSLVLGFSARDLEGALVGSVSKLIVVFLMFALFLLTYLTVFARFGGQTLGKIVLGLKVVGLDGHSLTTSRALVRALGMILAALPGLGGFLWAAFDLQKRAWHDKIGKTIVVEIRPPKNAQEKVANARIEVLEHP